jgi:glycerol transport system ATP-binding protein
MLELKDVSRSSGREQVLTQVSFQIPRNVPTSLLGLSPVERATLLRLLAGAERPQSGFIKLNGKDIAEARKGKGHIVQVGRPVGVKPSGQKVGKLIGRASAERVGLDSRMESRVSDLTPDQRMRVAIALAREEKPSLILLVTPSVELEKESRERFLADLCGMLTDTGAVVVLLAASADEAAGLGGDIVVLSKGRFIQSGPAAEIFAHPANIATAMATSHPALNMLQMSVRNGSAVLPDGSTFQPPEGVVLPADGACTLAFRPEHMLFERQGAACVRFIARAAGEESISGRRFARLTFAGSNWLTPHAAAVLPSGAVLNLFVDRSRLMIFGAEGEAITQLPPIAFSRGAGSSQATDSPGG